MLTPKYCAQHKQRFNSPVATVLIFSCILTLSACQTLLTTSSESNPVSISSNSYENEIYEPPTTLIPPIPDSDGDGIADELDQCPNTQQNAVVDARGCQVTTGPEMGLKMEPRVFFEKGSSEVSPKYFDRLNEVGIKMQEYNTATMRIEGSISENEMNDSALSKNRAIIVKNYLIMNHKIAPERIATFDCSAKAPIASNDTQEGRAMNRRVYGLVTQPDEDVYKNYQKYSQSDQCVEF